ncbi:MAG: hypothetical protein V4497_05655 [Bacteroidota bacterium]
MNLSKFIGAALIAVSLGLGYAGLDKIKDNSAEINFLGVKIDASNESQKEQGYIYIGLAVLLLVGGLYSLNKTK